jgi:cytochrome d ubiquinol oxidase subunit II
VAPWAGAFQASVGLLTLALFALVAAVYLTNETEEPALQDDFRARALAAAAAVVIAAGLAALTAPASAAHFTAAARRAPGWLPLHALLAAVALALAIALGARRFRLARLLAIAQASLMVGAWGLAQHPYLIAPDLTIENCAAPARTLGLLAIALAAGALLLFPSLLWLFRIFKSHPRE